MNEVSSIFLPRHAFWQPLRAGKVLSLLLTALFLSGLFLAVSPKQEQTVHTADGAAWTVSDMTAYIRGRLDDQNGRTYCELMRNDLRVTASARDQDFLDRLTLDVCIRRLQQPW